MVEIIDEQPGARQDQQPRRIGSTSQPGSSSPIEPEDEHPMASSGILHTAPPDRLRLQTIEQRLTAPQTDLDQTSYLQEW